jgi:2-hydroxy-3-oxopropionate reductase
MMPERIGFIGLGVMGQPMALNLMKAGHALMVYDVRPAAIGKVTTEGAIKANSPAHIGRSCEVIFTMLPDSPQVEEVVRGDSGILKEAARGTIIVDMSSIAPAMAASLAESASARGIHLLDAPVSGGEPKAIDGTLSIMVGGEEEIFKKVEPLLMIMGASALYMGAAGSGNITKLANQIMVALHLAAVSEAMVFAEKAGVETEKVFHAIKGGLAGSQVLNAKMPLILERNFKPGGPIRMHTKDLINVRDTALDIDAPIPLTVQVMEFMKALKADGKEGDDHGGLIQYYEKLAGVKVEKKKGT